MSSADNKPEKDESVDPSADQVKSSKGSGQEAKERAHPLAVTALVLGAGGALLTALPLLHHVVPLRGGVGEVILSLFILGFIGANVGIILGLVGLIVTLMKGNIGSIYAFIGMICGFAAWPMLGEVFAMSKQV